MVQFLVNNQDMKRNDLAEKFNSEFGTDYPEYTIRHELYKYTDRRLNNWHLYTEEQEKFIKENADIFSRKELLKRFNKKFNVSITYSGITQKCVNLGLERKIERITDEQKQFIIGNYKSMDWHTLCDLLNQKYGTDFNVKSLNRITYEMGLKKYERNHFTDEHRIFLMDNIEKYSYPKLTELFNEKFGTNCSQGAVTQQCMAYLQVKRGENYIPHNAMEIGEEVTRGKGEVYETVYVKVASGLKDNRGEMWKPKHQVIWEQNNRPVLDNEVVIFLDGNRHNFELDNLYCITRKILRLMNLNSWFTDNKELTMTAIKWCELLYARKESEVM